MAIALARKKIFCPNCKFVGKALVTGDNGGLHFLLFIGLVIGSFMFPPLLVLLIIHVLWVVFRPAKQICPVCKNPHPVPHKHAIKVGMLSG